MKLCRVSTNSSRLTLFVSKFFLNHLPSNDKILSPNSTTIGYWLLIQVMWVTYSQTSINRCLSIAEVRGVM